MIEDDDEESSASSASSSEELEENVKQKKSFKLNDFIDDEAELSGDDEVSEDEDEQSDDDQIDPELVDQDAPDLDSDQEEEVRGMYFKQLENEDRRAVLLMKEQLEDKNVALGQRRRKKFKWQNTELMENSLRRHYDPDDDDSHEEDDDEPLDDLDFQEVAPRLKRPTAESFLLGSTRVRSASSGPVRSSSRHQDMLDVAGPSASISDDSNSNSMSSRLTSGAVPRNTTTGPMDINRFLYRDREMVEALSTREIVITTREEKDKAIERELRRVLQSKSIFDQLYT